MAKKAKRITFDPKVFLATVDGGRTLSNYQKGAVVFSQGDPADAVFFIQKGKVKVTVTSAQGKEVERDFARLGPPLGGLRQVVLRVQYWTAPSSRPC